MPRNQKQRLSSLGTATSGNLKLTINAQGGDQQTANIAYNASTGTFDSAIEALSNCDDVVVTGGSFPGTPVVIEQRGVNAEDNLALMEVDATGITSSKYASVAETTPGVATRSSVYVLYRQESGSETRERQTINGNASVTAGSFSLTIAGVTVFSIPFNATVLEIIDAINTAIRPTKNYLAISTSHSADYLLSSGDDINIIFVPDGGNSPVNIATMTLDSSGLTGGAYSASANNNGSGTPDSLDGVYSMFVTRSGYSGESTASISTSSSDDDFLSALESVSSIGSGNVNVTIIGDATGTVASSFRIEFTNDLDGESIGLSIGSASWSSGSLDIATLANGGAGGTNEIQTVTEHGTPTEGSFTLSYLGEKTPDIAFDAATGVIQAYLEGLPGIAVGDVVVGGGPLPGSPVTITFQNNLGAQDVALLVVDDSKLKMKVEVTQIATPCPNAEQVLTSTASGGTFTLSLDAYGPTTAIAWNASAATIQSALEGILGVDNVQCSGGPSLATNPKTVDFLDALGGTKLSLLTVDGSSLTGGSVIASISLAGGCGGSKSILLLGVG
jgi:hypothetical protein